MGRLLTKLGARLLLSHSAGVRMVGRHLHGSADELDDNRAGGQDREYPHLVATNAVGVTVEFPYRRTEDHA